MKKKNVLVELLKLIGITILSSLLWTFIFAMFSPPESTVAVEPFRGACAVFGVLTACIILLVLELNSVHFLKQRVRQTLSNISVTNQRAANLLDKANRVSDKYMSFEHSVVSTVASTYQTSVPMPKKIKNAEAFENRLNNFPELKSNQSVMELLQQLRESENIIANFKLEHNNFVAQYNYQINAFPTVLFKRPLKAQEFDFYTDDTDLVSDEDLGI